jgi:hypothetical protein
LFDSRKDKRSRIPAACLPIVERLQCSAETWLDDVREIQKRFRNAAGPTLSRQSFRMKLKSSSPAS